MPIQALNMFVLLGTDESSQVLVSFDPLGTSRSGPVSEIVCNIPKSALLSPLTSRENQRHPYPNTGPPITGVSKS